MDFRTFFEQFERGKSLHDLAESNIPAWLHAVGRVVVALFSIAWLGGVLSMVALVLPAAVEDVSRGLSFRHTEATVLAVEPPREDQARHDANDALSIAYLVDGKRYVQQVESPERLVDADWATRPAPDALEPNATLPVWYDPGDPRTVVFDPIPQAALVGVLPFFLPFVMIGLGGLAAAGLGLVRLIRLAGRFPSVAIGLGPAFSSASGVWVVGAFVAAVTGHLLPWQAGWAVALAVAPVGLVVGLVRGWGAARRHPRRQGQGAGEGPSPGREAIASAPRAPWQGQVSPDGADSPAATPSPVGPWSPKRSSLAGMVFFAVFWNGLLSVFLSIVLWSFATSLDARWRYEQTDGNVVEAELVSQSGDEGKEFRARITYTYAVGGVTYTGDEIGLTESWYSDAGRPRRFVREHPPGTAVVVYYDPSDPARAVLDTSVEPMMWYMAVFLQPFVCVGVGAVWVLISSARRDRARRRFFATPIESVEAIPGWGPVRRTLHEMEVVGRPDPTRVAMAFAAGHAGVCFASIFLLLLADHLLGDGTMALAGRGARIVLGLGLAAGTVAALHVRSRRRRPDRLMVASDIRRVDVTTHDVEEEVYFDDVAAWETRPRERTGQWSFEDDDKPSEPYCLLRLVREDGGSLLVHTFDPADAAVAQRLSAHLSVATDAVCRLPTSGSGSADWDDDDH